MSVVAVPGPSAITAALSHRRAAHRAVFVRRISARTARRATRAYCRACERSANAGVLRSPASHRRVARRPGGGFWRRRRAAVARSSPRFSRPCIAARSASSASRRAAIRTSRAAKSRWSSRARRAPPRMRRPARNSTRPERPAERAGAEQGCRAGRAAHGRQAQRRLCTRTRALERRKTALRARAA